MCHILMCSRSGYYDWISLGKPLYKLFNESIKQLVLSEYFKDKRQGIVSLKMKIKKIHGSILTRSTVYRYMRLNQIQSIIRRKRYKWGKKPHHYIPNLLKRDFTTNTSNQKWSIDISYLLTTNKPLIIHSDRGIQYVSKEYLSLMDSNMSPSYSKKADPWDNACIESFHAIIKREWLKRFKIKDLEHAQQLVFEYIETFYNTVRIHGTLGYISPNQYEKQYENSRNAN